MQAVTISPRRAKITVWTAVILMTFCPGGRAYAQRTMEKQDIIGITAVTSYLRPGDTGGKVWWGRYGLTHYWKTWAGALPGSDPMTTGGHIRYIHLAAGGDFMYRLASTRSRMLSLYGGGGVHAGWELNDPWKRIPKHQTPAKRGKDRFLYGCSAALELEFYFTRRVALSIAGGARLTAASRVQVFPAAEAGIRISL